MRDTGLNQSGVPVGALPTVEVGGMAPVRSGCDPQGIAPHGLYALQRFSEVGVSPSVCAGPAKVCSVQYALGRPRVRPSTADRTRSTWLKPLVMKEITNTATSTGRTLRISAIQRAQTCARRARLFTLMKLLSRESMPCARRAG